MTRSDEQEKKIPPSHDGLFLVAKGVKSKLKKNLTEKTEDIAENLPNQTKGKIYFCKIGGEVLTATYQEFEATEDTIMLELAEGYYFTFQQNDKTVLMKFTDGSRVIIENKHKRITVQQVLKAIIWVSSHHE